MPSLAELQDGFAAAVRRPEPDPPRGITGRGDAGAGRRFGVYRNNHLAGLAGALEMTFPVVRKLVGEEFFRAAAMDYVRRHPPRSPVLLLYGERFGDLLDELPAAGRYPYLGDVARLEWSRIFALNARDTAPAEIRLLSGIPEPELPGTRLILHPSVRTLASRWPVLAVWQDCQPGGGRAKIDMERPERLLVVRPDTEVVTHRLDGGSYAFIRSLARGAALGEAAEHAMAEEPGLDLSAQLVLLFNYGTVAGIAPAAVNKIPPDQRGTPS